MKLLMKITISFALPKWYRNVLKKIKGFENMIEDHSSVIDFHYQTSIFPLSFSQIKTLHLDTLHIFK